jgi:HAMP domain-containing protein
MSIGPSPSDENIDFKIRSRDSNTRGFKSNSVLTVLLVSTLSLLLAIMFFQQRQLSGAIQRLGELEQKANALDSSNTQLLKQLDGLRLEVNELRQRKGH